MYNIYLFIWTHLSQQIHDKIKQSETKAWPLALLRKLFSVLSPRKMIVDGQAESRSIHW